MRSVERLILDHILTFDFRLEEERQDQHEPDHDGHGQGLESREGRVCELPGDEVLHWSDGRVEPVPGQQDRQVGWRVKHQRRKGIENAGEDNVELENILSRISQDELTTFSPNSF